MHQPLFAPVVLITFIVFFANYIRPTLTACKPSRNPTPHKLTRRFLLLVKQNMQNSFANIDHFLSAAPTSFCKCTCFTNSTIIPLEAPITVSPNRNHHGLLSSRWLRAEDQDTSPEEDDKPKDDGEDGSDGDGEGDTTGGDDTPGKEDGEDDRKEYRAKSCNDCNRNFCIDLNLPICKGASMEDVFTTCFRESCSSP